MLFFNLEASFRVYTKKLEKRTKHNFFLESILHLSNPKINKCPLSVYFMNKRGQYYLVVAILFVGIAFGLMSVMNSSKTETFSKIYEIQKEIRLESSKVIEYSSNTGDNRIEDFTKNYSNYSGKGIKIYYITGDLLDQEVYNYTNGEKNSLNFNFEEDTLNTTIEEKEYYFKFEKGENFHFIIIEEMGEEKYLLTE